MVTHGGVRPLAGAVVHHSRVTPAFLRSKRVSKLVKRTRRRSGRVLGRVAVLVGGPAAVSPADGASGAATRGSISRGPREAGRSAQEFDSTLPAAPPISANWPEPPQVQGAHEIVRTVDAKSNAIHRMDVAMLTALNEEYRSRPLVPEAPKYDQASMEKRSRKRLTEIHEAIDIANKRVLELGCGGGYGPWYVANHFDSEAWGVDVTERKSWAALSGPKVHLVCADIGTSSPLEADSVDRIFSINVFEHVHNPYETLAELYRVLRPGGLAWIRANLHRGPRASHIYRELYMPYPHLLFSDEVIAAYRKGTSGKEEGAAWVNHMTWAEYEDALRDIGFVTRSLRFVEAPLDEGLYERFYHQLGRYPISDLTKDFFRVIVQKPESTPGT
jgi:SAM-dependent methyltransferase